MARMGWTALLIPARVTMGKRMPTLRVVVYPVHPGEYGGGPLTFEVDRLMYDDWPVPVMEPGETVLVVNRQWVDVIRIEHIGPAATPAP